MRGLYAILDTSTLARRGLSVMGVAEAVIEARPAALQLRAKGMPAHETLALLRDLAPICRRFGVPLFANDRADLAALAGCDGVHVGQDDLPVEAVRRVAEHLRVGLSTHDAAQLEAAVKGRIDYVAVGPVFATGSKDDASPVVGLERLRGLVSRAQKARPELPIVAIGGISLENAGQVGALCDAVAVISALLPGSVDAPPSVDAIHRRALALHAAICGGGA